MSHTTGHILVVGAGIGGMRTAMDLAETGHDVTLVEQTSHVGGLLASLDYQFPTNGCGMCRMLPRIDPDQSAQHCLRRGLVHERIDIRTDTDIMAIDGEAGHFTVTLRRKGGYVDARTCMGCGACTDACPVNIPDPFNAGLSTRKAIHSPLPHVWPATYQIDVNGCTRCGACQKVCPTGAIVLPGREKSHFRILVVDDEAIVRESIRDWFQEEEGFHVDVAESGPAGLNMLAVAPYHLMLLDIKMPGMDGVEV
ncbi:MAG: 4Fe-4S dicluster domain-containing protein, partial [Desulfatirhabdiaceae bacterium]